MESLISKFFLGETDFSYIFSRLSVIKILFLSQTSLTSSKVLSFREVLEKTDFSLKTLGLSKNETDSLITFFDCISSSFIVEELIMESSGLSDESLLMIIRQLQKKGIFLKKLDLNENKLNKVSMESLGEFLKNCYNKNSQGIQAGLWLNLAGTSISHEDLETLFVSLGECKFDRLDLSGNIAIEWRNTVKVKELFLKGNALLSEKMNFPLDFEVEKLDFRDNPGLGESIRGLFVDGGEGSSGRLFAKESRIKGVQLGNCGINEEILLKIGEELKGKSIKEVDFGGNKSISGTALWEFLRKIGRGEEFSEPGRTKYSQERDQLKQGLTDAKFNAVCTSLAFISADSPIHTLDLSKNRLCSLLSPQSSVSSPVISPSLLENPPQTTSVHLFQELCCKVLSNYEFLANLDLTDCHLGRGTLKYLQYLYSLKKLILNSNPELPREDWEDLAKIMLTEEISRGKFIEGREKEGEYYGELELRKEGGSPRRWRGSKAGGIEWLEIEDCGLNDIRLEGFLSISPMVKITFLFFKVFFDNFSCVCLGFSLRIRKEFI